MKRLLIFLYFFVFASKAFAVVTIDITRGNLEPLPTAISNFYIDNPENFPETIKKLKLQESLPKVIKSNLMRSGLFYVLDSKSHIQKPKLSHLKPRFEDWRLIKAQIMVSGKLKINDKLYLIPGHCDPTCNLHDWYVCVRHGIVVDLWPISARGKMW